MEKPSANTYSRRKFVATSLTAITAGSIVLPQAAQGGKDSVQGPLSIREVIDLIKSSIPMPQGITTETVDTVKTGNPDQPASGIVTTMFATIEVIRKAIELKANFIITHEPTFYNHNDQTDWLTQSKVYQYKRDLLEKNNIVVWRFHDYWHTHRPDGVLMGVLTKLGWEKYYNETSPRMLELPEMKLKEIIGHCKKKLGIKELRYVGNPSQTCKKVLLMPGAAGGRNQITMLQQHDPDLMICGEVAEWETSEYIRDARLMGLQKSLIVLGHAVSEEPGMEWLVGWLTPKVPGTKVTHIAARSPFSFM